MMLALNDGRFELWQWDTGRTLAVDADCSQVHFSNKVFGRSIDVDVVDGVAIIPDILLQTDKDLNVWAFVGTAENGYTKISKTFKVNRRNKPADYVFTPVEQTTIAEIAAIAQSVRDDADSGAFDGAKGDSGVGIQSVEQTTTSTEDGGTNVVTVTKTDGTSTTFEVRNGSRGSPGAAGPAGPAGVGVPDGGTEGQLLGKTADGAAWVDPPQSGVQSDLSVNDPGDPAYVRNRTHWFDVEYMTLFDGEVTTVDGWNETEGDPISIDLIAGQTYDVTFNGVKYVCVATEDEDGYLYIGSHGLWMYDGLGEGEPPFAYGGGWFVTAEDGTHTVLIAGFLENVRKLDTKYLPKASELAVGVASFFDIIKAICTMATLKIGVTKRSDLTSMFGVGGPPLKIPLTFFNDGTGSCYIPIDDWHYAGSNLGVNNGLLCNVVGAEGIGFFLAGFPDENDDSLLETFKFSPAAALRVRSSTVGSTKQFQITVDDSGTISAKEIT